MAQSHRSFNEDTRVKIPATLQFLRLGYEYQSMRESDIDFDTKVFVNRFKPALERVNGHPFSGVDIKTILEEIRGLIRSNDLGRAFHKRLTDTTSNVRLVDWDNPLNNDFAVVDELPFTVERDTEVGSFRPDVTILVNGIPLAFLEVKKPNNEGTIQAEFHRMLDERLENPAWRKFFNLLQVVSFSNNMEYEDADSTAPELVKAGSFYTTPNGRNTSFSFFREDEKGYLENYPYQTLDDGRVRRVVRDLGYDPAVCDTAEFRAADSTGTPCNRFVTSLFDRERFLFLLRYGILYVKGEVPERHIMRYPQFFASRAIIRRLESGGKRGIVWHTQGSGKTELACYANRIIRDWYARQGRPTRFFFVVDRLELLNQDNGEFTARWFTSTNCSSRAGFAEQLGTAVPPRQADSIGEFVTVNIQKFESQMPRARNEYGTDVQRVFFIDEAHRSYALNGEYFKNLILCDPNAVFIALTGTPLLSKRERSNLKFGDYIHKYFYDRSIADGYTLRIKKEPVSTIVRKQIHDDLELQSDEVDFDSADIYESDAYVEDLCRYIEGDFRRFRVVNHHDDSIGGMIVCRSGAQARKVHRWFTDNSRLSTGLVISDESNPAQSEANRNNQNDFKYHGHPDLLVVQFMLTTGYDARRLKKMYLLRAPHAQNLLQTISRVNRPYKSPNGTVYQYGYITDFVDIEKEYDRTIQDYMAELELDVADPDGETRNSLEGLLVDVDTIRTKYSKAVADLKDIIDAPDAETFSRKLSRFDKPTLLTIRRLLTTIRDCFTEFMLSDAMDDADGIDVTRVKREIQATQERIDFLNLKDDPVGIMDIISDEEVVHIVYEFLKGQPNTLDLSRFDPDSAFAEKMRKVQGEIGRNRNPDDIRLIRLGDMLRRLFDSLGFADADTLDAQLQQILEEAEAINRENDRLAAIYNGSYAMVKTYQDATQNHPELSNRDVEKALLVIHGLIRDAVDAGKLAAQGREGFIDETKKRVVGPLLKAGLYKGLRLKDWIDALLSDLYTNLQNYQ